MSGAAPQKSSTGTNPGLFEWVRDLLAAQKGEVGDPLSRTLAALRQHFRYAAFFSFAISLLYLSSSLYMMLVYDKVLHSGSRGTLLLLTLALFLALATLALLDLARTRMFTRAGLRIERRLSVPIMDALMKTGGGNTRSRQLMQDFEQFRGVVTGPPGLALLDAPFAPIYFIVLFMLHWSFALLAVVSAVVFIAIARWSELRTREPTRAAYEATLAANGALETSLRHAGVIRALGMDRGMRAVWLDQRANAQTISATAAFDGATANGLLKFLRLLIQSLALGLGAWLVIENALPAGAMIAASILVGRALAPLEQIVGAWKPLATAATAYSRVKAALTESYEPDVERMAMPPMRGRVDVEQVYVEGAPGRQILSGVSFSLAPGEFLGVIGPSGAGKTTLARALFGLVPLRHGAVRFDGVAREHWRNEEIARATGFLPQEIALFPGTVRDNVSRFESRCEDAPSDTDAAVIAACELAGVHGVISRLPEGYATAIEGPGFSLSGGQRQRIALARALYRSPSLLVLDEPNANLDSEGEMALVAALRALKTQGKTIIVITHKPSLLANADKILNLAEGRVQMFGPRDQVLAKLAQNAAQARSNIVPVGGAGG